MEVKKTVTSIFIVPTLKIDKDDLKNNNFLNGYISDLRKDVQYEDAVYLLFKPENLEKFREFLEKEYEKNSMILDDYDYEDGFVVVVYKLNKKYIKDYELVMKGQYSRTSQEFQSSFPKIVKIINQGLSKDEVSIQFRIFKKSKDIREYWEKRININFTDDMEVWQGFDLFKESLDLDKVKKELHEELQN